jgi:hypothetical protein
MLTRWLSSLLPAWTWFVAGELEGAEPQAPTREVIEAWKKAGATFVWMKWDQDVWANERDKPEEGELPVFWFKSAPATAWPDLPAPGVPFGMVFRVASDDGLKKIAALKSLRMLDLWLSTVSDAR